MICTIVLGISGALWVKKPLPQVCYNISMPKAQIISSPKILGGKPVIAGTRISVELILDRIAAGMNEQEILKDYPHLNEQQIQAAVSYARRVLTQHSRKVTVNKQSESATLYTHEISRR